MRYLIIGIMAAVLGGCVFSGEEKENPSITEWNGTWISSNQETIAIINFPNWEAKYQDGTSWIVFSGLLSDLQEDTSTYVDATGTVKKKDVKALAVLKNSNRLLSDGTKIPMDTALANSDYGYRSDSKISYSTTYVVDKPDETSSSLCLPRQCGLRKQ